MTRIALLRHYPTDWNREGRLQGRIDRPLTADSRAVLAKLRLPPPWDGARIVTSGLARTVETARLLAPGAALARDPRLAEISWGVWEGRRAADLSADPESGFAPTGDLGWNDRPPGGESMADAWGRVRPALAELAPGGPAVLVVHKAIMRVILAVACGAVARDTVACDAVSGEAPAAGGPLKGRGSLGEIPIKRGRLHPLNLREGGLPANPEAPIRLAQRLGAR